MMIEVILVYTMTVEVANDPSMLSCEEEMICDRFHSSHDHPNCIDTKYLH